MLKAKRHVVGKQIFRRWEKHFLRSRTGCWLFGTLFTMFHHHAQLIRIFNFPTALQHSRIQHVLKSSRKVEWISFPCWTAPTMTSEFCILRFLFQIFRSQSSQQQKQLQNRSGFLMDSAFSTVIRFQFSWAFHKSRFNTWRRKILTVPLTKSPTSYQVDRKIRRITHVNHVDRITQVHIPHEPDISINYTFLYENHQLIFYFRRSVFWLPIRRFPSRDVNIFFRLADSSMTEVGQVSVWNLSPAGSYILKRRQRVRHRVVVRHYETIMMGSQDLIQLEKLFKLQECLNCR